MLSAAMPVEAVTAKRDGIAGDQSPRAEAFARAARAGEADVLARVHELLEGGVVVNHGWMKP